MRIIQRPWHRWKDVKSHNLLGLGSMHCSDIIDVLQFACFVSIEVIKFAYFCFFYFLCIQLRLIFNFLLSSIYFLPTDEALRVRKGIDTKKREWLLLGLMIRFPSGIKTSPFYPVVSNWVDANKSQVFFFVLGFIEIIFNCRNRFPFLSD